MSQFHFQVWKEDNLVLDSGDTSYFLSDEKAAFGAFKAIVADRAGDLSKWMLIDA